MHILRAISRFIIGITFILSGFLKAIDPVGVALKIDEYLNAFHLGFLDFTARPAGVLLSAIEFLIGVCILKGLKMQFFSKIALWFVSFFTLLTFYSALFNPVQDCGCFGEAFHLTNWQTFFKNILLLACSCIVYFQRSKFIPIAKPFWENIYIGCYSAFILIVSIGALLYLPPIDFGGFKAGTDLRSAVENQPEIEYETTFTYSKNGENKEFTLNNLPDSTWTFVEADTKQISASSVVGDVINFILKNSNGEYVTEQVLDSEKPTFFVSIYYPDRLSQKRIERVLDLRDSVMARGAGFYIVSGNNSEQTEKTFGIPSAASYDTDSADGGLTPSGITADDILYTDYKTALLFNRSNGGAVYVNDGTIISKWSKYRYPAKKLGKLLNEDYEVVMANTIINEQIFIEISLIAILLMILTFRIISKRRYKGVPAEEENLPDNNLSN